MEFLEQQQQYRKEGSDLLGQRAQSQSLQRRSTIDENRIYRKHGGGSSSGNNNGTIGKGGLGKKLKRQNSINLPSGGSSSSLSGGGMGRRMSGIVVATIVDTEKLLAAKKRRQDSLSPSANKNIKKTWSEKVRIFAIICVVTLLILSASSLLFISLLVVDPILVGLRAEFNHQPGICRTLYYRNATGPSNCVMPSCREGCTADLYVCTFIYVRYFDFPGLNISFVENYNRHEIQDWDSHESLPKELRPFYFFNYSSSHRNNMTHDSYYYNVTVILMINPNGCGYPPEVNCTDFYDHFLIPGTIFPCFYSSSFFNENMTVAVPFYDRSEELINFGIYFGIPLSLVIIFLFLLFFLIKIRVFTQVPLILNTRDVESPLFYRKTLPPKVKTDKLTHSRLKNGTTSLNSSGDSAEVLGLEELPSECVNGHGPKKKSQSTPLLSINETELTRVLEQVQQLPSTSKNLP